MSYEIYKSVTQTADGKFKCISSSSNTYPLDFREWTMDYFDKEFPTATVEEKRACWMIHSTYWGDKFYQSNWKKEQKLGNEFMREHGYTYEDISKDKFKWLAYAREFLLWKKERAKIKLKKYIVSMTFSCTRQYVGKKSSRHVWPVYNREKAKIFKAYCKEDVERLFSGYNRYEPQIEEVE